MSIPAPLIQRIAGLPIADARLALAGAIVAVDAEDALAGWRKRVAAAWEEDMQPVRNAIAAALHAGGMEAISGLRKLLPGLLREVNRSPRMAAVMARAMLAEVLAPSTGVAARALACAERVSIDEGVRMTPAREQWQSRSVFETDLSSAELRGFSAHLRNRSIFSARTTNAEYLGEIAATVDDILAGKIGIPEGRLRLMRKLKELGYDPAVGFPDDMANIPPAERDSLQDLSSERRIDLVLETNVRMAQGYSMKLAGETDQARFAYPAWELVRIYPRRIPRGAPESKTVGWPLRWADAGNEVQWVGALRDRMMARKDSPIWGALGDGAGGYTDTLLNPFPPFAFRSGFSWRAVPREEAVSAGLLEDGEVSRRDAEDAGKGLTPGQEEVTRIVQDMPEDLRAELMRELAL